MSEDLFDEAIKSKIRKIKNQDLYTDSEISLVVRKAIDNTLDSLPIKKNSIMPIIRNSTVSAIFTSVIYISTIDANSTLGENKYAGIQHEEHWNIVIDSTVGSNNIKFTAHKLIGSSKEISLKYSIESLDGNIAENAIDIDNIRVSLNGEKLIAYKNDSTSKDGIIKGYIYLQSSINFNHDKLYNLEITLNKINDVFGNWGYQSQIKTN